MFIINFDYDLKKIRLKHYQKLLITIANHTYKKLNLKGEIIFDCSFVNAKKIREINNQYRKKDYPTDVISFALWDNKTNQTDLLGELYICYEKIVEQHRKYHHSFKREISFLFLHGLLHLLGYDHMNEKDEKIMFNLQDIILNELEILK
ncbi:MAG: rRNA maturation RNase YbeY [Ureaplasma sp.]|nr:rRNA maturation RNase YbeY [Ureaplasma sp.]MDE7221653.1 rRNA maturation RNase YbeY [Ureaplasma sp.]